MRGIGAALLGIGLLFAATPAAQAQTSSSDACGIPARAPARASLGQATMFTPMGYGPFGWAPMVQPWGPDPWGAAAIFGPPGLIANAGPLGPGLTANAIAAAATANGGTLSPSQQVDLASQQQTELSTLLSRYTLGGQLELAGATWAGGLAGRASAARTILPRLCRSQQAQAAGAAAGAQAGAAAGAGAAAAAGAGAADTAASTGAGTGAGAGAGDAPAGSQP
jgi:hypothetical protein